MKNITSCFILFLLFFSCGQKPPPLDAEYEAGLIRYFDEIHGVAAKADLDELVIIPLNGCNACIADVLNHLSVTHLNLNVLLTGETDDDQLLSAIAVIESNYTILRDYENMFARYRTGLIGPNWLSFTNERLSALEALEYDNIETILK